MEERGNCVQLETGHHRKPAQHEKIFVDFASPREVIYTFWAVKFQPAAQWSEKYVHVMRYLTIKALFTLWKNCFMDKIEENFARTMKFLLLEAYSLRSVPQSTNYFINYGGCVMCHIKQFASCTEGGSYTNNELSWGYFNHKSVKDSHSIQHEKKRT